MLPSFAALSAAVVPPPLITSADEGESNRLPSPPHHDWPMGLDAGFRGWADDNNVGDSSTGAALMPPNASFDSVGPTPTTTTTTTSRTPNTNAANQSTSQPIVADGVSALFGEPVAPSQPAKQQKRGPGRPAGSKRKLAVMLEASVDNSSTTTTTTTTTTSTTPSAMAATNPTEAPAATSSTEIPNRTTTKSGRQVKRTKLFEDTDATADDLPK
jgi:hypothetical protein